MPPTPLSNTCSTFNDGTLVETELCYFTIPQIVQLVKQVVLIGHDKKCLWSKLLEYISNLFTEMQNHIRPLASEQSAMGKKRKAHDDRIDNCSRKKPQGRQAPSHVTDPITWSAYTTISSTQHEVDACTDNETRIDECQDNVINELINGPFLQNTSQKTREDCIKGYIHRTSNVELAQHACMVWARLLFASSKMTEVQLDEPPNIHLLKPTHPHPEHVLHMESLLYNDVLDDNGSGHVCNDCSHHLRIGQMHLSHWQTICG